MAHGDTYICTKFFPKNRMKCCIFWNAVQIWLAQVSVPLIDLHVWPTETSPLPSRVWADLANLPNVKQFSSVYSKRGCYVMCRTI